jgi:hypothetical protein
VESLVGLAVCHGDWEVVGEPVLIDQISHPVQWKRGRAATDRSRPSPLMAGASAGRSVVLLILGILVPRSCPELDVQDDVRDVDGVHLPLPQI